MLTTHTIPPQEYLTSESLSEVRREYVAGQVYPKAGSSKRHNRITGNIGSYFLESLDQSPCQVYIIDLKVHINHRGHEVFYYPDVVVACDPTDDHELYLEKPSTIFEVLSESTERVDRQEKFYAYRTLQSLNEYVIISQERMEVTIARRSNGWLPEVFTDENALLDFPSLGLSLALSRIYRGIDFTS